MRHLPYSSGQFPHWTRVGTRYRDLDTLNHVNNAIFSTYFEEARIAFIRDVPELMEQIKQGYSYVLLNLHIDFIEPARYPDILLVGTGILETGNTSINFYQALYNEESKNLLSTSEVTGVWYDVKRERPSRIPELEDKQSLVINFDDK